ncbi:PAS domain-containing protein [Hirsutella rhossiliensis]|uniref:PAS domain-containing protein n=1 Tax=Hirsutella rhossiliensis TaxID=111463 RepID=A0A9P8SLA5_9HYPO|nr:PAS domain-containing protein [Hirsutella rhossiliensis]KAH0966049.1 PAS domain-containing protein [Hirsutella rhossiliensis]
MDRAGAPALVHPLSPVSSHSDLSLEDLDFSVKPLPPQPTYASFDNASQNGEADLPPLQVAHGEPDGLDPVDSDDLDPGSFDLVMPAENNGVIKGKHELEQRSELLFSSRHLQAIFDDPAYLHRFSNFLYQHRPGSVPLLTYYLEALKALRAIEYSNAVLRKLEPLTHFDFTHEYFQAQPTANLELQAKADMAFEVLAREDLPMYITHVWIQTVTVSIRHRIRGTSAHASEGLAEVFCLTDPSRPDNPIVFMSEEFNRTTQYGVDYVIGRNCRFLQGPHTNPFSVSRIRQKLADGVEHYETFLNYRRDGSPFMNLVMLAPLYDSRGTIRYFIGAQVDVSGLAKDYYGLGALKQLVDTDAQGEPHASQQPQAHSRDEFTQLAEILGPREIETVRDRGGDGSHHAVNGAKHRVVLRDPDSPTEETHSHGLLATAASLAAQHNGRLTGVYENYLLVRPYPSLRILFTSPSMRMPGILQSPLLDRIGGSARMRDQFVHALAEGQGVTAKVKWLSVSHKVATYGSRPPRKKMQYNHPLEAHLDIDDDSDTLAEPEPAGRSRWLHCTPLVGSNGKVGVWMIVIVNDEPEPNHLTGRHIGRS